MTIQNKDNLCLPRAILVGVTHMWNKKFPGEASARAYNKMRDGRCNHQIDEAIALKN